MRARSPETLALLLAAVSTLCAKEQSRFVTAQMRTNALANVKKYPWARTQQKRAIAAAERWVKLSDHELWDMVTSQELPRDIHTNKEAGCPKCGKGIGPYGNYPWKCDCWNKPWKITCPNCRETYPKNDFHAFYTTALDEHGMFRKKLGDRSLLLNADHPEPNDPLHKVYVDDGYGMTDEKGRKHRVVAYYVQWGHWRTIYKGINALSRAYTLTGDKAYAHKTAVLLDRIADVYPDMDFMPLHRLGFEHSHGGPGRGRIEGCIWETYVARNMARAYDCVYDGLQGEDGLMEFCARKASQHDLGDKTTIAAICRHIEDHLLLEVLKSCKDGRISGNTGMTHTCLAVAAIALDRKGLTEQWLDWLFDPGFPGEFTRHKNPVPWVLVGGLDRDGMGAECGGYGLIWTRSFVGLAEMLTSYPDYTRHNMVSEYPKLKQCFYIEPRLMCLDAALPNIGDSGATGTWGRVGRAQTFVLGYRLYKDPQLAALAWRYAGENPARLRTNDDIFEEDPDALADEIARTAKLARLKLRCDHLGRYGQAYLQTEQPENGRALWIHYGYGKGHSHCDNLNIGLYAKNIDMLPELGYPEYTGGWPKRHAWTANTISHNTLLVNDCKAKHSAGGKIGLFAVQPPLRVMDVESRNAYRGIEAYRRTVALVDVSETDSYVLDVFRARGGRNHRLSYHGPAQTAVVEGISVGKQASGTFAGPHVAFATLSGEQADFYRKSGFTYLYDIERSAEPVSSYYTVDWKAEDKRGRIKEGHEPHLRLHALTPCDEVALASGDPPQNKRGNPRRLRYLIQSRLGENMASQFVTVLEPYDKARFIRRVRRLKVEHGADQNSVTAVAVELENGTTDILISCEEPTRVDVERGIAFDGQFGMIRLVGENVTRMRMSNARLLRTKELALDCEVPAYKGKVTRVDASDPANNLVFMEPALPQNAALVGKVIHFRNDVPWDTSYDIKAVGDGWISTGDITIVRGFNDPKHPESGYKYMVNPGDEYVFPTCVGLDR